VRKGHDMAARAAGFLAAGKISEAEKAARAALKLDATDGWAKLTLARALAERQDADALRVSQELVESAPTHRLGLIEGSALALRMGQSAQGLAWAKQVAQETPDAPAPWETLLKAQVAAGALEAAQDSAENIAALTKAPGRQLASIAFAAAQTVHPEAAHAALERAVRADPGFAPAVCQLARVLDARGKKARAERLIEEAWTIAPQPGLAQAYGELAPIETRTQRYKRFQALAARAPDHPETQLMLAQAALDAGDALGALEHLSPLLSGTVRQKAAVLAAETHRRLAIDPAPHALWPLALQTGAPDPQWHCTSCGARTPGWQLTCPACGAIGALSWDG
jgi:HemY protein